MAVKLLIDSASDINAEEAKELGLEMIPMTITFGDEDYMDGVNLLPKTFYEKLLKATFYQKQAKLILTDLKKNLKNSQKMATKLFV